MCLDWLFDQKLYISYYAHILMGAAPFSCNFNRTKTTFPTYVYFNMDRETDRRCGRVSGQPPCTTHYSSLQHHSCQLLRLETRTCECATCIHISIYANIYVKHTDKYRVQYLVVVWCVCLARARQIRWMCLARWICWRADLPPTAADVRAAAPLLLPPPCLASPAVWSMPLPPPCLASPAAWSILRPLRWASVAGRINAFSSIDAPNGEQHCPDAAGVLWTVDTWSARRACSGDTLDAPFTGFLLAIPTRLVFECWISSVFFQPKQTSRTKCWRSWTNNSILDTTNLFFIFLFLTFLGQNLISWRKLQFHDGNYNFMTQVTISWRKLQFHDANHNFMTQITISCRKLLFHDGHERNDRQTHHCDTGRQVDLPGNLDPTCVELCMCVGWVQVTRPLSVSIQMIVQRAADNQPSGWCGKRSADIIFVG